MGSASLQMGKKTGFIKGAVRTPRQSWIVGSPRNQDYGEFSEAGNVQQCQMLQRLSKRND